MTTLDPLLVNSIVEAVMAELSGPVRAAQSESPRPSLLATATASKAATSLLEVAESVVTAKMLEERVQHHAEVKFANRAIVTPAAVDWLRNRRLKWSRGTHTSASPATPAKLPVRVGNSAPLANTGSTTGRFAANGVGSAKWHLVAVTVTPAVKTYLETLKRQSGFEKHDLLGSATEAAAFAQKAIALGECDGVAVIVDGAASVACQANRQSRVRAAVASSVESLDMIWTSVGPNVVCIPASGRSFIDLRNIGQSLLKRGVPPVPTWSQN